MCILYLLAWWHSKHQITVNTSSCPWGLPVTLRWANVCENTSTNMHDFEGSAKGWLTPNAPVPFSSQRHRHWYCRHVNRSVRQYPLSLTSWTQSEAYWHAETPNTCPLPASKIHTPLFLVTCNPLIISVGWIWDDWVLKVLHMVWSHETD